MEEKEMLHLLQSEPERGIGQIIVQYEKAIHTIFPLQVFIQIKRWICF